MVFKQQAFPQASCSIVLKDLMEIHPKKILINPKISPIISKLSLNIELTIKIKLDRFLWKKSFVGVKKYSIKICTVFVATGL